MTTSTYSPLHTVLTTAKREIQILFSKKSVIITLLIMMLAIIGLIGFAAWQKDKSDSKDPTTVAVVGVESQTFEGTTFEPREAADRAEAEQLVRDGEVDTALVVEGDTWQVISDGFPKPEVVADVNGTADGVAQTTALEKLGISPEEFAAASPNVEVVPVDIADLDAGKDDAESEQDFIKLLTTFVLLMAIVFMVITFAAQVGSRVTEEKLSLIHI